MKEQRVCEIRAEAAADSLILKGMPIVFNQPTVINDRAGSYIEVIERGALDGADLSDTRLLYNHDLSKVPLARTPKTLQLSVEPAGLTMTATLPDTEEARSVHTAVDRGDLSGMSFAFKVPAGGDRYDAKTNTRTITKIEKVLEISVVPFPAYPQTSVEARSTIDGSLSTFRAKTETKIKINQILKRGF
ncbi:MAG: HK97 family phage prohead protease [Bacillota bacterium]|nr:HK97 family phage prohead protease [Bacillota bacterium]